MGRKVFVTSDISVDERLLTVAERDPLAALIWPWILTTLDDWGRAEAKSRMLKAKVFPCNDIITAESIAAALHLYHEVGLIELYEVTGRPYLSVPHDKWFKYQTHIHGSKRIKDDSKFPPPPLPNEDNAREVAESRDSSREFIPSPSPTPTPSITNNNNNAREEIEITVNESVEIVTKTAQIVNELSETVFKTEETRSMAIGTRAVYWAEKNWGRMISPGEAEDIIAWCDEFSSRGSPDPDGVVIEGLNECDAAGPDARNKRYLEGILVKWREAGVLTVDHAKARNAEHKSKSSKVHKRNKGSGDNPPRILKVPSDKYEKFYLTGVNEPL